MGLFVFGVLLLVVVLQARTGTGLCEEQLHGSAVSFTQTHVTVSRVRVDIPCVVRGVGSSVFIFLGAQSSRSDRRIDRVAGERHRRAVCGRRNQFDLVRYVYCKISATHV